MMMGFGHGINGAIVMFVIWFVVIGLGVWLLASLFPKTKRASKPTNLPDNQKSDSAGSALQILERRYARGELTKEQYEGMRHDLEL
jgi:putative membrane protein